MPYAHEVEAGCFERLRAVERSISSDPDVVGQSIHQFLP